MSDAIDISAVAMEVILNTGDGRTCIDQALDSLAEFDLMRQRSTLPKRMQRF